MRPTWWAARGGWPIAIHVTIVLALAGTPARARAAGGWETWLYPGDFTGMIATSSEVWCATREGGLLRWDRATATFETIRREPGGITSNELTSLALDPKGRLWVGTGTAGVARRRADGSGWDAVNRFDGLPSDSVTKLVAVGDTIWIGTKGGIALWNGRIVTGSLPDGNTVSFDTTFQSPLVTGVVQLGDSLFLSTISGVGMAHLSTGLTDWRPLDAGIDPNFLPILDMVSDGRTLFVVGVGFTYRFDFTTETWQYMKADGLTLTRGRTGVFLGASSGVWRWDGSAFQLLSGSPLPLPKPSDGYRDLLRATDDASGVAFAGTSDVLYEQTGSMSWVGHRLPCPPDNGLLSVATEGSKLYVTTLGGVGRFDGADWKQWRAGFPCVLPACDPDTTFLNADFTFGLLAQSDGTKWVGSWGTAVETFTDAVSPPSFVHKFVPTSGSDLADLKETWLYTGFESRDGGVWFGLDTPVADDPSLSPLGLAQYDPSGNLLANFYRRPGISISGNFVRAIAQDRNGTMWIGFGGDGVDFFPPPASPTQAVADTGFRQIQSTNGLIVKGIACYGDSLWILSTDGLRRFTLPATVTDLPRDTIAVPGGQDAFAIRPLAIAADGSVWCGSGQGLWHFLPGGGSQHYDQTNSPLASDAVRDVVIDPRDGRIWIGTAAGLHRFDPSYVPPAPPATEAFQVRVSPNPAFLTELGPGVSLLGDRSTFSVAIYDLTGRRLRRMDEVRAGVPFWDGRDDGGNLVRPGVYFIRASAGGRSAVARLVLLH